MFLVSCLVRGKHALRVSRRTHMLYNFHDIYLKGPLNDSRKIISHGKMTGGELSGLP